MSSRLRDWMYQKILETCTGAIRVAESRSVHSVAVRMLARAVNVMSQRVLAAAPPRARVRLPFGGRELQMHPAHSLPRTLAYHPAFGRNLLTVLDAVAVDCPRIIDVGANIGDTALMLLEHSPAARILCIEGDPSFCGELEANTSSLDGITIVAELLGDGSERGGRLVRHHGGSALVELHTAGAPVQTLDHVVATLPAFAEPHLIKIDTDGFDPRILRGAAMLLRSAQPVLLYEWHPYFYERVGEDPISHIAFLRDCGYNSFFVYDNLGRLLVRLHDPAPVEVEGLARYSRARRETDDFHYDVAAFPACRSDAAERLWLRETGNAPGARTP